MATMTSSGNPALNAKVVDDYLAPTRTVVTPKTMTVGGTAVKTLFFLVVLVAGGAWGWASATEPVTTDAGAGYANTTVTVPGGFWLASFGALGVGIAASVNPKRANIFGLIYAVLQGYVLGAISAMFDAQTEGIVGAAIASTVCVFFAALVLYATRIIRPTQKMAFAVVAGLGGLGLFYLFVWVLSIFNWSWLYSDEFRTIGLVVTGIAIVLAALSLVLDFGMIEVGVDTGAPKFMEWYSAYALMVTLIWLYLMILRVLALLNRQ
jgi:uncharacterized YccA/Bax inhibitor family protein